MLFSILPPNKVLQLPSARRLDRGPLQPGGVRRGSIGICRPGRSQLSTQPLGGRERKSGVPSQEVLIVFLGAVLLLAVTPGPDLLYIAARSAGEGRAAGLASVLGISVGIVGHTAAVSLGLSSLLRAVPLAFEILRWAGAAYLIVLGLQLLLRPRHESAGRSTEPASIRMVFVQGFLTNILNPKVALFFVAFLPQFVDPSAGRVGPQLFLLGCLFNVLGSCVNLAAALLASRGTAWLQARTGSPSFLHRISGSVLVALGARLALSSNR